MKWIKEGRAVSEVGTTVTYRADGTNVTIESRKRHIPHANRSGTWDHTSYFVLKAGKEMKECFSLKDAKEYAETQIEQEELPFC